jgi:hypothetical protein
MSSVGASRLQRPETERRRQSKETEVEKNGLTKKTGSEADGSGKEAVEGTDDIEASRGSEEKGVITCC